MGRRVSEEVKLQNVRVAHVRKGRRVYTNVYCGDAEISGVQEVKFTHGVNGVPELTLKIVDFEADIQADEAIIIEEKN